MNIKKEFQKEYEEYVTNNQDAYGNCVIKAGEAVMRELDVGKTPKEAMDVDDENMHELTGYMAGALAQAVSHFHERGDEFKIWWNGKYGVGAEEKGVVNPAIITLKSE